MKEPRFHGHGLCYQCGKKEVFGKFRCDRCDKIYELIYELVHELHVMNRRIHRNLNNGKTIDIALAGNLVDALLDGSTRWDWSVK